MLCRADWKVLVCSFRPRQTIPCFWAFTRSINRHNELLLYARTFYVKLNYHKSLHFSMRSIRFPKLKYVQHVKCSFIGKSFRGVHLQSVLWATNCQPSLLRLVPEDRGYDMFSTSCYHKLNQFLLLPQEQAVNLCCMPDHKMELKKTSTCHCLGITILDRCFIESNKRPKFNMLTSSWMKDLY